MIKNIKVLNRYIIELPIQLETAPNFYFIFSS